MGRAVFRDDINGLRAIAVSSVLAFHFQVAHLSGGFAGVDIFFVISGFLMTQILLDRASRGALSITDFYMSRARRIVPALLVLGACLSVFGLCALDPLTLADLGKEVVSALLFYSNILFGTETNYFDARPNDHWLLHTWSLSLEWQFYLIYPILFWGMQKLDFSRRRIFAVLAIAAVASYALASLTPAAPSRLLAWSFYTLPTRAWELLLGGCVVLCAPPRDIRLGRLAHYAGLFGVFATLVVFPGVTIWPSAATLLPVGATALLLWGGVADARWAAAKPVNLIGKWSYSIYLWHWPLVAAKSYYGLPTSPGLIVGLILLSVALGAVSYELVEKRFAKLMFPPAAWRVRAGGALAIVIAMAVLAIGTHGFERERAPNNTALVAMRRDKAAMGDWQYPKGCAGGVRKFPGAELCYVGDPAAADVVVLGDSQAQQLVPRYAEAFRRIGHGGALFITHAGCPPLPGVDRLRPGARCAGFAEHAFDFIDTSAYRRVVIASIWNAYFEDRADQGEPRDLCFKSRHGCTVPGDGASLVAATDQAFEGLTDRLRRLHAQGRSVYVSTSAPYDDAFDPRALYRAAFTGGPLKPLTFSRQAFEASTAFARQRVLKAAQASGATVVEPLSTICDGDACPITEGADPLFMDRAHFRSSRIGESRFGFLDTVILGAQYPGFRFGT